MHEYSIVQALLERVEAEAAAHRAEAVSAVRVRIGELSGVEVDLLRTAYETFRERSICAAAELEVVPVAARWVCRGCGLPVGRGGILRCGECGAPARLAEGDEIILDRVELEVA